MKYLAIALTVLLAAAACGAFDHGNHVVDSVGDCSPTHCRVVCTDGIRATVRRPVDVGDRVLCYALGGCLATQR
jgi:hypothetical protein